MKKPKASPKSEKDVQPPPAADGFLVVGIGASAGGVEALRAFFEQVPAHSAAAYVVILHLSPSYDSHLAQVLQTVAKIPVMQVTGKVKVQPDHIYVIPPNRHLVMEDGHLAVLPNTLVEERRAPVDIFFRTLADTHGPRAVCVVLSGTGANGSMGLKRVKERGGAAFVQNPREAEFNEMPRNAISTGLVDDVLNVAEIPRRILAYRDALADTHIEEEPEHRVEEDQQALREIFTQLRLRTGHDFSNYKRATLMRRIGRRMAVHTLTALPAYAALSSEHPKETQALLKDLLISVTNFFRDNTPFIKLEEEILPAVFEHKTAEDGVRIWVAGCATGEEAYTIAMLCAERTLGVVDAPRVQIFATDIDEAAIAAGRDGYYTLNDAADVSAERLSRFFTREGEGYRIRREVRETVLFAAHNFLKDPPFSRIDLVTCRNVLIYLARPAQERVMEIFHFALKPGGFLMLGTSESADGASDLFSPFNREQHIYQSRAVANQRTIVVPETVPQLRAPQPVPSPEAKAPPAARRIPYGDLHMQLLEQYAPPSLVADAEFNVVHTSPRAGRYLQFVGGEPTQAVLKLIQDELRTELRNGLYQAAQKGVPVASAAISVSTKEGAENIRIHVRPVMGDSEGPQGHLLVVFEPATGEELQENPVAHASDEAAARHLEEELSRLRTRLRASNEQHEFQAEELKAGNEELQSMNEELRSATEELETSKEELQSINEELNTVNQELKVKVEEATMTSNNLQNLINSTDIGTIFLDRSFRVVLFTPAARSVFNLIPADYGRPLSDITSRLEENTVLEDAQAVLAQLQRIERETRTTDGRVLLIRLSPYRSEEDRIRGVVVSLLDITGRKRAEQTLREAEEHYRVKLEDEVRQRTAELAESRNLLQATMNSSTDMIQVFQAVRNEQGEIIDFIWILNNHASEAIYGDILGKSLLALNPGVVETGIFDTFKKVVETGIPDQSERHYVHEQFDGWFHQSAVKLGDGVATTTSDITTRKRAELDLRQSKSVLQDIIDAPAIGIVVYKAVRNEGGEVADFVHESINRASVEMLGEDFTGRLLSDHGENGTEQLSRFIEAIETGRGNSYVWEVNFRGRDAWFSITNTPLDSDRLVHTWEDVTERKKAEQEIKEQAHFISSITEMMPDVVSVVEFPSRKIAYTNRDTLMWVGFDAEGVRSMSFEERMKFFHPDDQPAIQGFYERFLSLKDREENKVEYRLKNEAGHWVNLSLRGKVFRRDEKGAATQVLLVGQNITAQKKAEQEILRLKDEIAEQAEEKYRTLFESIDEGVAIVEVFPDERGRVTDMIWREANPGVERHAGMGGWVGKRASEIVPNLEQEWLDAMTGVYQTGQPVRTEAYIADLDRWIDTYYSRVGGPDSPFIASVFQDISERKRREARLVFLAELAEDFSRLSSADEIMQTVGARLGAYLQITTCNFTDVYEAEDRVTVHNGWSDPSVPSTVGSFQLSKYLNKEFERASRAGETVVIRNTQTDPRTDAAGYAALHMYSFVTVPFHNGGRWTHYIAICDSRPRDWRADEIELIEEISARIFPRLERARAEDALRESEERLQLAASVSGFGIHDYDIRTGHIYWSPELKALQGLPPDAALSFEEVIAHIHPDDRERMRQEMQGALAAAGSGEFAQEFRIIRQDNGEVRWLYNRSRTTFEGGGAERKPVRNSGIAIDSTARKLPEQQKEQFIGIASHELRTPVTSIKAYAEILQEMFEESGDSQSAGLMRKLGVQVDRLTTLIYTLLDTTRITEGRLVLQKTDFAIDDLIADTAETMQRIAGTQRIELSLKAGVRVHADHERIRQVVINLIGNAIKYAPGTERIVVRSVPDGGGQVRVCVQDFGIGMDEAVQRQVFDRFFREDEASTVSGLGLGLFISAGIVRQHGGTISVQSRKGEGSLFCFTLPLAAD